MLNNIIKLDEFLGIVNSLSNKTKSKKQQDISDEALWVLSNTDIILDIVKPKGSNSIDNLRSYIIVNNSIGIENYSTWLSREIVSWISEIDHKRASAKWQLANPFIWFYSGVELVLMIVLGFPIKKFNPDFDYNGKHWKYVSLIFTVLSGLSSIIGFYFTIHNQ